MERKIEDLVETLRNGVDRGKQCTLLIGAGCSVQAGIPTAAGFVELIEKRYPSAFARATEKTYPHCMAELPPSARRDLIAEFVDPAKINWAHLAIAQLMKAGYVDRVLTVNFDPLVVQACALVGEFPAVYDFAASQLFKPAEIPDKAVFHLHGQRSGFRLLHTKQEVKSYSESLSPVFEDAGRGRTWLVAGYSGTTTPYSAISPPCPNSTTSSTGLPTSTKNPPRRYARTCSSRTNSPSPSRAMTPTASS